MAGKKKTPPVAEIIPELTPPQSNEDSQEVEMEEEEVDLDILEDQDDIEESQQESLMRGMIELFEDDDGNNVVHAMNGIKEAMEKQNKILYKIMTLLAQRMS